MYMYIINLIRQQTWHMISRNKRTTINNFRETSIST